MVAEGSLPQIVRFCDVAGIGRIIDTKGRWEPESVTIEVMDYWHGALPTNTVTLRSSHSSRLHDGVSNKTVCVFLAYTNLWYEEQRDLPFQKLAWDYVAERKSLPTPVGVEDNSVLYKVSSVFPIDKDGGYMAQWVSNLVQCVKVKPDEDKFMSLLCEGMTNGVSQEVKIGAVFFAHFVNVEPKDRLLRWKDDRSLPEDLRKRIEYQLQKRFLWVPPSESSNP